MLTTPNYPPVLSRFGNDFQDYWLHDLPRHQGETDWLLVPQSLLPCLLGGRCDICFLPVLRNIASSSWPFKGNQEWLCNDITQLPQHSRVHPISSPGLVSAQFVQVFPDLIFLHQSKSSLLRACPQVSGTQRPDLKVGPISEEGAEEGIEPAGLFYDLCHQGPCPIQQQALISPIFLLLHIPHQIEPYVAFGLPHLCMLGQVPLYFRWVSSPCFHLLYASFFLSEFSPELHIHPCKPFPPLLDVLLIRTDQA